MILTNEFILKYIYFNDPIIRFKKLKRNMLTGGSDNKFKILYNNQIYKFYNSELEDNVYNLYSVDKKDNVCVNVIVDKQQRVASINNINGDVENCLYTQDSKKDGRKNTYLDMYVI